jgi:hypothetical protein
MKKYTKDGRLADIIALITLLSIDISTFRTIDKLDNALKGLPQSAKKWEDIAKFHPEFFRFNTDGSTVALLIRSYAKTDEGGQRAPLLISETQKLIDTAIALHDKEILLQQRNSYIYSILVSLVVAIIAVLGVIYSANHNNSDYNKINNKIDSLNKSIQQLEFKIDKISGKN